MKFLIPAVVSLLVSLFCLMLFAGGLGIKAFDDVDPSPTKMMFLLGWCVLFFGMAIYFLRRYLKSTRPS